MRGRFIVIYGANNLGKSIQVDLLAEAYKKQGVKVKKIKYPIYDLKPTGPEINAVLRKGKKMSELNLQKLYAKNRLEYQKTLEGYLEKGYMVVAEDYTGTGIAWGMVRGLSLEALEKMNKGLLKEDLGILLFGKRFTEGIEKTHRNETDEKIWETSQKIHLDLAEKYEWKKVNANGTKKEVFKKIAEIINNHEDKNCDCC